ncbi:MAG TPA: DUF2213 domain-containing protein [Rhizobium sp.]
MPPVSTAQRNAMFAAAEGESNLGIPKKVGKEFVAADAVNGHAAGILYVAPDGDVLLLRRSSTETNYAGHWALPGGGGEEGETPEQTADREAHEEMGMLIPESGTAMKLLDSRVTPTGKAFHTFVQSAPSKFVPQLNDEHSGYAWAPLDQLPDPLHPAVRATIADRLGTDDLETPEDWAMFKIGLVNWLNTEEHQMESDVAEDSIAMDKASVRNYDADGRLHVTSTPISKANICEYYGREIPGADHMGLVPDRKYRLLRHPDELRRGADTFNNLPLLRRHVAVSADDHKPEDVIGSTGSDASFEAPYLTNSLVVWSKDDIEDIEREMKKELSSAYRYRADMTAGTYEGEPYDGIMRDIVGNHVALVKEGRAGPDVVVGDEAIQPRAEPQPRKEVKMAQKPLILSTKKAVDAITAFFTPRMAADAKVDGLDKLLLALDESEEDDDKKDTAEDENDLPEPGGEKGKGPAKDKAKDTKAKDKASDEDDDDKAEDEEDDEDEKKGEDEESVTKEDVKSAMDEAIAGERQRQHAIRDAERFVRPWVGDLTIAFDSAEDVYKTALEMRGKTTKGIHPSAYRSILEMVPKPGSEHRNSNPRVAMDSASTKGFSDMYPDAMRIGINH